MMLSMMLETLSSSILEMCSILQELKAPGVAQPGGHLEI